MNPNSPFQRAATDGDLLPVVNERDEPVGVQARRKVHLEGLRHRAVHVCVFDAGRRIVLQQRSRTKDTYPGCWDWACTGHVDPGETYDAAARRELKEELGIALPHDAEPQYLFKHEACETSGWEFQAFYALRWTDKMPFNPDEIERLMTLAPHELDEAVLSPRRDLALTPAVALGWPPLRDALAGGLFDRLAARSRR